MKYNPCYKGASVLVTGASGFIGSHLCRRLASVGAKVTGTYFSDPPNKKTDKKTDKKANQQAHEKTIENVRLDLTDSDAIRHRLRQTRPDFIFHLAANVQGSRDLDAVLPTFQHNLLGTVQLLLAAQEIGCCNRIVIANSQEEPNPRERNPVPASPYAASKYGASNYARMFHALYGLPVVIARIFMVYGPGQKDHDKLIPYTILQALGGSSPQLSSGERKIDWIYISDLVEGLLHLGSESGIEGRTLDLGGGQIFTIKEVVTEILNQIDPAIEGHFGAVPDRLLEQEPVAGTEETMAAIGWRAQVPLETGLAKTISWYRGLGTQ